MNKILIISGFIILFFLLAMSTNPTKEDYVHWISSQVKEENWIVGAISGPIFRELSKEKDFIAFTIFETQFDEDEKMISLGAFNKIYTIYTSDGVAN